MRVFVAGGPAAPRGRTRSRSHDGTAPGADRDKHA
jgi:hypothetical protein